MNAANLYGIKAEHWSKICTIIQALPFTIEIILFGSRAKGNYKPGSDIDICLKSEKLSSQDLVGLSVQIDELNLPWVVDILHYESLTNNELKELIDRVGIVLPQSYIN